MKASELRIGNFVIDCDEIKSICAINKDSVDLKDEGSGYVVLLPVESATPTPLTEEWLRRFGFEKRESIGFSYYEMIIKINSPRTIKDKRVFTVNENCSIAFIGGEFLSEIQYVHQLQNLYFALTGEELELK